MHLGVAQEDNTIAWTGGANPPTTFSVFLNNPDSNVLVCSFSSDRRAQVSRDQIMVIA